jgi:hypothetical protein
MTRVSRQSPLQALDVAGIFGVVGGQPTNERQEGGCMAQSKAQRRQRLRELLAANGFYIPSPKQKARLKRRFVGESNGTTPRPPAGKRGPNCRTIGDRGELSPPSTAVDRAMATLPEGEGMRVCESS